MAFLIFIFGLCIGSFLNCVIYRLEKDQSFISGRSFCPSCNHVLNWQDLIPVLSFIFLKGRCRYCKEPISVQYPAVEILTGLIFLLIFNYQFSIFNQFSIFSPLGEKSPALLDIFQFSNYYSSRNKAFAYLEILKSTPHSRHRC